MKIRINGNSVRLRLKRSDVTDLAETGIVSQRISFGLHTLDYILKAEETATPKAVFESGRIIISIPEKFAAEWPTNEIVGIEGKQDIGDNDFLKILVEKDFKCLDHTDEDQSDNYENPNRTC